ncbi:MAG TPA: hypothetical protein VHB01_13065 [Nitrosospira sp.]|nr:hypothetical protein [Nitrosospira sp.]
MHRTRESGQEWWGSGEQTACGQYKWPVNSPFRALAAENVLPSRWRIISWFNTGSVIAGYAFEAVRSWRKLMTGIRFI